MRAEWPRAAGSPSGSAGVPLPTHPKEVLLAAHEQGRFWEMHDVLFKNQRALDRESLEGYARPLEDFTQLIDAELKR